jgi:hypothetical protein
MLASTGVQVLTGMPMMPYLITMGVQAGFALSALPRAVRVYRAKKSLLGSPLSFTSIGDIAKIVEKHPDSFTTVRPFSGGSNTANTHLNCNRGTCLRSLERKVCATRT